MQQIQMRQIMNASPAQESAMLEQALTLCTRCLSYDFIGTNPDESSEDVGTIQVRDHTTGFDIEIQALSLQILHCGLDVTVDTS